MGSTRCQSLGMLMTFVLLADSAEGSQQLIDATLFI